MINNTVTIVGTVVSEPQYDHMVKDEKFYLFYLRSMRRSNIPDVLPVIISEKLMDPYVNYFDMRVEIKGSFRSYNLHQGGESHKLLFVFVESLKPSDEVFDINSICLEGYICKPAIYRETPCGRQISDLCLAVNRPTVKSDYLPIILWSRNAVVASTLPVGTKIRVCGRVQERWYTKRLPDGQAEERCCYEVSCTKMEIISGGMRDGEEIPGEILQ
jgi:single-stranded DNA-binding protein